MKRLIIDAFGGDHAPDEIVKGAVLALNDMDDISITLSGDENKISAILDDYEYDKDRLKILHASEVIHTDEEPMKAIRSKKDSSIVRALEALRDKEAQVLISAGSTGAVLGGATVVVKRVKGIKRPGLAPLMPTVTGGKVLLIDCGANVDCKSSYLLQFAIMGSLYCEHVLGIKNPRVGLLNNGAEASKGNELTKQAYPLLENAQLNFVGNCEPRYALSGDFDVIVADGFAGNVLLKSIEGTAMTMMQMMIKEIKSSSNDDANALLANPAFGKIKKVFDHESVGGAILLGIDGGVIKVHGNAEAGTILSAVKQGRDFIEGNVVNLIREKISDQGADDYE